MSGPADNPLQSALREWLIGSEDFLKRMMALVKGAGKLKQGRITRRVKTFTVGEIMEVFAEAHGIDASEFVGFRSVYAGREMAALLCKR